MATVKNAFRILNVNADVQYTELKHAYHQLALKLHPDKQGGDKAQFQELKAAYDILKDTDTRRVHLEVTRPFRCGVQVLVFGLSELALNGQQGTVNKWDGLRLWVDVAGRRCSLRPENVRAAPLVAAGAWAHATGAGAWASASSGFSGGGAWASAGASEGNASAGTGCWGGLIYCPGTSDGGGCPNWAQVSIAKGRCKTCRDAAGQSGPPSYAAGQSGPMPTPSPQWESGPIPMEKEWWEKLYDPHLTWVYLKAAREVDAILRKHPPSRIMCEGATFAIHEKATFAMLLWRLCITADTDIVPKKVRKLASHCGGVVPKTCYGLHGFTDTPMVADPTNQVYARVVARLTQRVHQDNPAAYHALPPWGLNRLAAMSVTTVGDVCEAVLAAANAAADAEDRRPHNWETLCGGRSPSWDITVPLFESLIIWECKAMHEAGL